MLSEYFKFKTNTESFKNETESLIKSLEGKKVIIYGVGDGFFALDKKFNLRKQLNIVAVADKKFETSDKDITNLRQIAPGEIPNTDYDIVLVTNEQPRKVYNYITGTLEISEDKVLKIFNEEIKEEALSYNYLCKYNFSKTLPKLVKRLKGKKVLLYGAGIFLEAILKFYDLSELNIIGIADKRFDILEEDSDEKFQGYKAYGTEYIKELNPDYVLVSTKFYVGIIENLYFNVLKNTKIKVKPLVRKDFITLLKEVWK